MSKTFSQQIGNDAFKGIKALAATVKRLEANENYPLGSFAGTTSNPPTLAQINGIIDTPANIGVDYIALIVDAVNSRYWLVWTDGTNWYYEQVNVAV